MNSSNFVTTINLDLAEKLRQGLLEQGFELSQPAHTIFSGKKKGVSCTLYSSGKLMVQGKEMGPFLEFYLEPEILQATPYTYQHVDIDTTGRIGIDESGKGDFFGPLCVAGVCAQGDDIKDLIALGVKDSKKLSDNTIVKIGRKIRADFSHHIIKINPLKYNELYQQFGNLNRLLAWGHAATIEQLVASTGCTNVIIDQFAAEEVVITALKRKQLHVDLHQRHRGEEDVAVAAASILARQTFVEGIEELGKQFEFDLPKGASDETIRVGRALVAKYGPDILKQVAKLHFKTLDSILGRKENGEK